ncbi:MAG TPA: hypothetical protein PK435_14200 [Thermoanaerobaculaceae bacterium]|nr:hypothetical protein [Thermoanaerobaculaceae bacterium]
MTTRPALVRPLLTAAIASWLAVAAIAADVPTLGSACIGHLFQVGRDGRGRVATWDWDAHRVRIWQEDGSLAAECTLSDARLGYTPSFFAIREDRALLKFDDPPAGNDKKQRGVVVDLDRCKVLREITLDGAVLAMEPSDSGWLLTVNDDLLLSDRYRLVEIDDEGKTTRTFEYETSLRRVVRELKLDDLKGAMFGRLVAVSKDAWFLPHATYELWRLPQHGLPLRRVEVPECLTALGRRVTGSENEQLYKEMLKHETKEDLEVWKKGTPSDSFMFATTAAAAFDRTLAVAVRDPALGGADRLDVWDMRTESMVAMVPLPSGTNLVSLGTDHAWLVRDFRTFERLELPDLSAPIDDLCKAHAVLVDSMARKLRAAPPAKSPTAIPRDIGTATPGQPEP